MSTDLQSGPSAALKIFVTACFVVWIAISYLALFALGSVFWVAVLESRFHEGALVLYVAALILTLVSAVASLRLWKRVHDRPELHPTAAKWFAGAIALSAIAGLVRFAGGY